MDQWSTWLWTGLAPWLCCVTDNAESKLSGAIDTTKSKFGGVNDTAESKYSSIIETTASVQTPLSQFELLVKALTSFKEKIKSKFNQGWTLQYYQKPLRQKLKNMVA
jgi:hypothetical protein